MIDEADDVDSALAHQTGAVVVGRDVVAWQTGNDDAVGELAGWAEQEHLFVEGWRTPLTVRPGAQGQPW